MLESLPPELLLHALPVAVLVKLHSCEHVFLPVHPCTACPVHTATCSACMAKRRALHGVVAVEPLARTWRYEGPALEGQFINVKRCQLIAHWVLPPRVASEMPSFDQLVSIGLSDKIREVLESGPPEDLVQMLSTLVAKTIQATRVAALQAKQRLGWRA